MSDPKEKILKFASKLVKTSKMFRTALCILLCASASALTADASSNSNVRGFVKPLEFKHILRVCNAYPYNTALDIYRGSKEKLTKMPLHYKTCEDFEPQLKDGDKLEFKVGDASAGTYAVSALPQNDAVLLLVISRHDTASTAASFMSHVFASHFNSAEVVIMDTYKGTAPQTTLQITDIAKKGLKFGPRSEELRFDSVMAVSLGSYEVELKHANAGKEWANRKAKLVALADQSYAIIRVGVGALQGQAYPEELLIFPNSVEKASHGAAATTKVSMALLAVLLGLTAFC